MYILNKLLVALIGSVFYTIFSFIITFGLYHIKGKELPDNYEEISTYSFVANFILIFLILLFFRIEV